MRPVTTLPTPARPSSGHLARLAGVVLVAVVGLLASVALAQPASAASDRTVLKARNIALAQIGDPYSYGAAGPNKFDCSGLVYYATHHAGMTGVPRTSSAQYQFMRHISKSKLRPGDFMFFHDGGGVYHVGIFLKRVKGKVLLLHSPSSGKRVSRAYAWTSSWYAATMR